MTRAGAIPDRIGVLGSIGLFGVPAVLLWVLTAFLVPALVVRGWEPLVAWFSAGALLFVPFLVASLVGASIAVQSRSLTAVLVHLRVRGMSPSEWRIALVTLVLTIVGVAGLQAFNSAIWPGLPPHPPFMKVAPLAPGQYYIFALWLPFFFFNIVGEELWWRGFIQPRQEPVFGAQTWIVQGVLHGAFHLSFGWGLMFILLPVLFSIPWAVQRTRNTTVGIVLHAAVNGPGFIVASLGLLPV